MKRKICFFSGLISRSGGTERVGILIANELVRRGFDVSILSFWNSCTPFFKVDKRIKIDYLLEYEEGKLYRTYIYPIIKLRKYIKKEKIDVLIDIDTLLSRFSCYSTLGTKCKLISWEHFNYCYMNTDKKRIRAKKMVKKYADKLVVLTKEDKKMHIDGMNFKPENICQIYNPSPFKTMCKYDYDNRNFLAVGRLTNQKGFDLLINAWKIFEKNDKCWTLTIVGDGEDRDKLEKLAKGLKRIKFVGKTDDIENYYKNSACYILSSRYEGFPMVILEAQSFGLPIISFDCKTGPKEMVFNEKNGYLVENQNVKSLANAMIKFSQSKETAEKMSLQTKKFILNFSIEKIGKQWEDLICNMISNGGKDEDSKK